MHGLKPKQQRVFQYINRYVQDYGIAPTYEQIAQGLGFKAVSTVHHYVHLLQTAGLLTHIPHGKRSIDVGGTTNLIRAINVPIKYKFSSGQTLTIMNDLTPLYTPQLAGINPLFALMFSDDSLKNHGICMGDMGIFHETNTYVVNDTVLGQLSNGIAFIRQVTNTNPGEFHPLSGQGSPFRSSQVTIWGRLVTLIREW